MKGVYTMEIKRYEDDHIITVWLTNEDQQNEEILQWLEAHYPIWKKQGYLTVVYKSGHEDLYDNTLALLKHNRRLSAEKEVAAAKEAQQQSSRQKPISGKPSAGTKQ